MMSSTSEGGGSSGRSQDQSDTMTAIQAQVIHVSHRWKLSGADALELVLNVENQQTPAVDANGANDGTASPRDEEDACTSPNKTQTQNTQLRHAFSLTVASSTSTPTPRPTPIAKKSHTKTKTKGKTKSKTRAHAAEQQSTSTSTSTSTKGQQRPVPRRVVVRPRGPAAPKKSLRFQSLRQPAMPNWSRRRVSKSAHGRLTSHVAAKLPQGDACTRSLRARHAGPQRPHSPHPTNSLRLARSAGAKSKPDGSSKVARNSALSFPPVDNRKGFHSPVSSAGSMRTRNKFKSRSIESLPTVYDGMQSG